MTYTGWFQNMPEPCELRCAQPRPRLGHGRVGSISIKNNSNLVQLKSFPSELEVQCERICVLVSSPTKLLPFSNKFTTSKFHYQPSSDKFTMMSTHLLLQCFLFLSTSLLCLLYVIILLTFSLKNLLHIHWRNFPLQVGPGVIPYKGATGSLMECYFCSIHSWPSHHLLVCVCLILSDHHPCTQSFHFVRIWNILLGIWCPDTLFMLSQHKMREVRGRLMLCYSQWPRPIYFPCPLCLSDHETAVLKLARDGPDALMHLHIRKEKAWLLSFLKVKFAGLLNFLH